jgi:plastocyanin
MSKSWPRFVAGVFGWILSASAAWGQSNLTGEIKVASGFNPNDLVVYIANPPASPRVMAPASAVLDQRNQAFHPHVLAIVKGTTVKFTNSDRVAHNVFSQSPVKSFDLGKIAPAALGEAKFEQPGTVEVLCGFHSRMLAYIRVLDHPFFSVPDKQGHFIINNVPPGTYQLRIWHESLGEASREVTVTQASTPIRLSFPQ